MNKFQSRPGVEGRVLKGAGIYLGGPIGAGKGKSGPSGMGLGLGGVRRHRYVVFFMINRVEIQNPRQEVGFRARRTGTDGTERRRLRND